MDDIIIGRHYSSVQFSEFDMEKATEFRRNNKGWTRTETEPMFGDRGFHFWIEGGQAPFGNPYELVAQLNIGRAFVIDAYATLFPDEAKSLWKAVSNVMGQDMWGRRRRGFGTCERNPKGPILVRDVYWTLKGGHLGCAMGQGHLAHAICEAGWDTVIHEANRFGTIPTDERDIEGKVAVVFDPARIQVINLDVDLEDSLSPNF